MNLMNLAGQTTENFSFSNFVHINEHFLERDSRRDLLGPRQCAHDSFVPDGHRVIFKKASLRLEPASAESNQV